MVFNSVILEFNLKLCCNLQAAAMKFIDLRYNFQIKRDIYINYYVKMCMHYASLTNNNVNGYAVSQRTLICNS